MGTDLISSSFDESGMLQSYSAAVTRVVAGSPDAVRTRLAEALERLGFHVLEEQPLLARRRTSGWGASGCTTKVLELPTTVLVKLKATAADSTEVTFNYTVRGGIMLRGDWRVIAREVDAAVALASSSGKAGACPACGTDAADDFRFCRRCGVPLVAAEPAELEMLRLAAATEAGTQTTGLGLMVVLLGLVALIVAAFAPGFALKNPAKLAMFLTLLGWTLAGTGLLGVARGYFTARRALNVEPPEPSPVAPAPQTGRLPAAPEYVSVTERTTDLLEPAPQRRGSVEN
jgi:hypothetical protein